MDEVVLVDEVLQGEGGVALEVEEVKDLEHK